MPPGCWAVKLHHVHLIPEKRLPEVPVNIFSSYIKEWGSEKLRTGQGYVAKKMWERIRNHIA